MNDTVQHHEQIPFQQLLQLSPMAAAVFRDGRLIWANRSATQAFGDMVQFDLTVEELAQRLLPDEQQRRWLLLRIRQQRKAAIVADGSPLMFDCLTVKGETVQCEMVLSRLEPHSLLIIQMAAGTQRTEELMGETQKMASLGRLAEGMGHELNNPLAAISQNIQLIWQRLLMKNKKNTEAAARAGTTLDAIEEYLSIQGVQTMFETILEQSIRAGSIVHQLLKFAPNDLNHRYLQQDVGALVEQAVLLAKKKYFNPKATANTQVRIVADISPELPQVICQAWKIIQSFLAILTNGAEAIDRKMALGEEGRIIVTARREDDLIRVEFADNGVGMTAEVREKVFEPYFKTKRSNEGTGLGLASCYYIIHQEHFGNIAIRSVPGKGTVVTVDLPHRHPQLSNLLRKETPEL